MSKKNKSSSSSASSPPAAAAAAVAASSSSSSAAGAALLQRARDLLRQKKYQQCVSLLGTAATSMKESRALHTCLLIAELHIIQEMYDQTKPSSYTPEWLRAVKQLVNACSQRFASQPFQYAIRLFNQGNQDSSVPIDLRAEMVILFTSVMLRAAVAISEAHATFMMDDDPRLQQACINLVEAALVAVTACMNIIVCSTAAMAMVNARGMLVERDADVAIVRWRLHSSPSSRQAVEDRSLLLKNMGNTDFSAGSFEKAMCSYSTASLLLPHPGEPHFAEASSSSKQLVSIAYGNSAQAYVNLNSGRNGALDVPWLTYELRNLSNCFADPTYAKGGFRVLEMCKLAGRFVAAIVSETARGGQCARAQEGIDICMAAAGALSLIPESSECAAEAKALHTATLTDVSTLYMNSCKPQPHLAFPLCISVLVAALLAKPPHSGAPVTLPGTSADLGSYVCYVGATAARLCLPGAVAREKALILADHVRVLLELPAPAPGFNVGIMCTLEALGEQCARLVAGFSLAGDVARRKQAQCLRDCIFTSRKVAEEPEKEEEYAEEEEEEEEEEHDEDGKKLRRKLVLGDDSVAAMLQRLSKQKDAGKELFLRGEFGEAKYVYESALEKCQAVVAFDPSISEARVLMSQFAGNRSICSINSGSEDDDIDVDEDRFYAACLAAVSIFYVNHSLFDGNQQQQQQQEQQPKAEDEEIYVNKNLTRIDVALGVLDEEAQPLPLSVESLAGTIATATCTVCKQPLISPRQCIRCDTFVCDGCVTRFGPEEDFPGCPCGTNSQDFGHGSTHFARRSIVGLRTLSLLQQQPEEEQPAGLERRPESWIFLAAGEAFLRAFNGALSTLILKPYAPPMLQLFGTKRYSAWQCFVRAAELETERLSSSSSNSGGGGGQSRILAAALFGLYRCFTVADLPMIPSEAKQRFDMDTKLIGVGQLGTLSLFQLLCRAIEADESDPRYHQAMLECQLQNCSINNSSSAFPTAAEWEREGRRRFRLRLADGVFDVDSAFFGQGAACDINIKEDLLRLFVLVTAALEPDEKVDGLDVDRRILNTMITKGRPRGFRPFQEDQPCSMCPNFECAASRNRVVHAGKQPVTE